MNNSQKAELTKLEETIKDAQKSIDKLKRGTIRAEELGKGQKFRMEGITYASLSRLIGVNCGAGEGKEIADAWRSIRSVLDTGYVLAIHIGGDRVTLIPSDSEVVLLD